MGWRSQKVLTVAVEIERKLLIYNQYCVSVNTDGSVFIVFVQ